MQSSTITAQRNIVRLPRHLLMADAPAIRDIIKRRVADGINQLVLDLSEVELIDSSGLSVLISARNATQPSGGEVVLASPGEDVTSLIEITCLHELFAIFDDCESALAAFN